MRLISVLDAVNQIEKNSFIKIIDSISSELKEDNEEIQQMLSIDEGGIKNIENSTMVKLFGHCKDKFKKQLAKKLQHNDFQMDILLGILLRDGNSIMSRDWLNQLYKTEIEDLQKKIEQFVPDLDDDSKNINAFKKRDYNVYRKCVQTALENDSWENREQRITSDEKSVLNTLSKSLGLSSEEIRKIYYSVVDLKTLDVDHIIESLKRSGVIFFRSSKHTVYIPDEFVWLLRSLMEIELSTKYFRRILRNMKDGQINRIARNHNIDSKSDRNEKITEILRQGVGVRTALLEDIFKEGSSKSEKKDEIQEIIKKLDLRLKKIGSSAVEKVDIIIEYFLALERDDNIGMSADGYERFLADANEVYPDIANRIRTEFELQQEEVLKVEFLLNYGIKPMDIVDLLTLAEVAKFIDTKAIKKKGDPRSSILNSYKDVANLLLENYTLIAARDINGLKEKGIAIKEAALGIKFEELTKKIFEELGFVLDEDMRKQFAGTKTQPDLVLKLEGIEIAIVECKSIKDKDYNKYASVSRQLSSYVKACESKGHKVSHCIVVSNGFSDDFIAECEYDCNLHLSLITASGLYKILSGYRDSSMKEFPKKLFKKSGLIDPDRVIQVINR